MTTPKEFIESFLQEKTAAWAESRTRLTPLYSRCFGEPLLQHAELFMPRDTVRAVVEEVRQSDGVTSAITCEHFRSADFRTRYRLAADGQSWKIVGIDRECFFCRRTGKSGTSRCEKCAGEGWCDTTNYAA